VNRIIVCDTGPLLHLQEAKALLLLKPAGKIFIPSRVLLELMHHVPHWKLPVWIGVQKLNPDAIRQATTWVRSESIDSGEAESISLALQLKSDWFLTDDTEARQFAESLGIETHGSIGVLLWAASSGHIDHRATANQYLNALANSSLWISDRVIAEASKAIDELMEE